MAFVIQPAFAVAATRSFLSFSSRSFPFRINSRPIRSTASLSERKFQGSANREFETEGLDDLKCTQKRNISPHSNRGVVFVTDITRTEWCQKQMELSSLYKGRSTEAIKTGVRRHKELEKEVLERDGNAESDEDIWSKKFINSITGVNRLLSGALTREFPVIGLVHGVWISGIIDEIRIPAGENTNPILVETKTCGRNTLPSEPQIRNGRLQLMCYKLLWDKLVTEKFPTEEFFDCFSLNPTVFLSEKVRRTSALAGVPAQTLDEIVKYLRNTCSLLLPANNQMILRYVSQKDHSLLGEVVFEYDPDWLNAQLECCLEVLVHGKEARFAPKDERWKCQCFPYASVCPVNVKIPTTSSAVMNTRQSIICLQCLKKRTDFIL